MHGKDWRKNAEKEPKKDRKVPGDNEPQPANIRAPANRSALDRYGPDVRRLASD